METDLTNPHFLGRVVRQITAKVISCMYIAGGFRLRVIGKRSSRHAAPIITLAPHSSFVDSLPMTYMGGPSIVAKGETASIPFFGSRWTFFFTNKRIFNY